MAIGLSRAHGTAAAALRYQHAWYLHLGTVSASSALAVMAAVTGTWLALLMLMPRISLALDNGGALPEAASSLYPVFWNVNAWSGDVREGSKALPVRISRFGFISPNRTTTGGGCTLAGCVGCNHSFDCEPFPCPKKYWRGCWQGDMPQIHEDGTLINGGVPQAANLSRHLDRLRQGMPKWIPDPHWSGNAMLDFEAWDPVYTQNSASTCGYHGACYQDLSIKLVKEAHPDWPRKKVEQEAESQFNKAALEFFVQTLLTCRSLRPKAKWGFYGYFYGKQYPRALWEAMSMFNPQLYMYGDARTNNSAAHEQRRLEVASIVSSAVNISRQLEADGLPRPVVYPVGWQYYPSRVSKLDPTDLASELLTPYNYGADGLILWGDDPEDTKYWDFVANTTGPMLADFEKKIAACAATFCSGHGRCLEVPIQPLYRCSADSRCVAQPADGRSNNGVPKADCDAACGPDRSKLYRCLNSSCVPAMTGVTAAECSKMCGSR
eukprot:SAG31_NODE_2814_length_5047_cov_3.149555_5_plen_493_part_00